MVMLKKSIKLAALLLATSVISACNSNSSSNGYVGDWHAVEDPDGIHFTLHPDKTFEIFAKNDYYKGEYKIENQRLCMYISASQNFCGEVKTVDNINILDMGGGHRMVQGKENAEKLHSEGISKSDSKKKKK
ncbi:hypothetical protein [Arcanobacterium hippocoleae]|uniref:Lipoprotein n=1 Tax=Arcanobacterium hippocoleae TaxID=149017 RepID=A0ABU1T1H2_9ACTO|nr:hypothetical protein [Arcanobacterium hippocoleae]MDR6939232.1 hypothetical protein [Arcanobacterium hippocoleae]